MMTMAKGVSAMQIAQPSAWQELNNIPVLVGEYAVKWNDVGFMQSLWSIICYVNGYPHKRLLSTNPEALAKRVNAWLTDPVRLDP